MGDTGQLWTLGLDFGTSATRVIRVDLADVGWAGLDVGPGDVIAATAERAKLFIVGDSWVEGTSVTAGVLHPDLWHMAFLTGRMLDASCFIGGISGSGYTARSAQDEHYLGYYRKLHAVQARPRAVLIFGSVNDGGGGSALVGTNAAALFSHLAIELPATRVIVVGPQSYGNVATSDSSPYLKTAALAAPNVASYSDPRAEQWVTGTGNSTAPTGNGTADVYHNGYNTSHLTAAGNAYYAARLADVVRDAAP